MAPEVFVLCQLSDNNSGASWGGFSLELLGSLGPAAQATRGKRGTSSGQLLRVLNQLKVTATILECKG